MKRMLDALMIICLLYIIHPIMISAQDGGEPGAVSVTGVTPGSASPGSRVKVSVTGSGFRAGATVKCALPGLPDIPATNIAIASAAQLSATFNFAGKAPGIYDLVVTNANGQAGTLTAAITVGGISLNRTGRWYMTIQAAIDDAQHGDTIRVAAGTYKENLIWSSKSLFLLGAGASRTIIHGNTRGCCLLMNDVPTSARVEGFTFTGGSGGGAMLWTGFGGGLCLNHSSPTITRNIIIGNKASAGGGIALIESSARLESNSIIANSALSEGGGVDIHAGSPTLINNIITDNACDGDAGGVHITSAWPGPVLIGNVITGNRATGWAGGAGVMIWGSGIEEPGADAAPVKLINCTSAGNTGGGVTDYEPWTSKVEITNCIIWGNTVNKDLGGYYTGNYPAGYSAASIQHSQIGTAGQLTTAGTQVMRGDPLFADVLHGDYHLKGTSPCIQAGKTNTNPSLPSVDVEGNNRIGHGLVDLGAYEYTYQLPLVRAGADQVIEQSSLAGAKVTLKVVAASNPQGKPLTYTWSGPFPESGGTVTGTNPQVTLQLGKNVISMIASDGDVTSLPVKTRIEVKDTTPPTLTAPGNVTVDLVALQGRPVDIGTATATDICDAAPVITHNAPAQFPLGTTTVTWTARDTSGNMTVKTQTVTVNDTSSPILLLPGDVTAEQTNRNGSVVNYGTATATSNHGVPTISSNAPAVFPLGTTVVTWTATDTLGNTTTGTQRVTVIDSTPPAITVPGDISVEQANRHGTAVTPGTATAVDICDAAPVVTNNAPAIFPLGTTMVIWSATDASGNTTTKTQRVTVRDSAPPTITVPGDITREATNVNGTPVNIGNASCDDFCDASPVVTNNDIHKYWLGTTIVTWTVTDASGNITTKTQRIIVVDTVSPHINVPGDVTVEQANRNGTTVNLGTATAHDLCDETPTITNDAPAVFPLGTTTVTWTATDDSGNSDTATQRVIVRDTNAATLTVPADVVAQAKPNGKVDFGEATAEDLCDAAPTITNNAPNKFPAGVTMVTWTATDASDNRTTKTQKITVVAATPPSITAPADITTEQTNRNGTAINLGTPTVVDPSDPAPTVTNDAPAVFPLGTTVVTWTVTDINENSATATQRVTIRDTTAPAMTVPADITIKLPKNGRIDIGQAVATDLCDALPTITSNAPAKFELGTTTITWTATDDSGNTTTGTQRITATP